MGSSASLRFSFISCLSPCPTSNSFSFLDLLENCSSLSDPDGANQWGSHGELRRTDRMAQQWWAGHLGALWGIMVAVSPCRYSFVLWGLGEECVMCLTEHFLLNPWNFITIIYLQRNQRAPPAPSHGKVRPLLKPTDFNLINIPSYKILLRRYVSQEHKTIKL